MKKVLVTFKYESQLNTSTATNYTNGELMKEIVELLRAGGVEMCGWEEIHGEEIDNPCDTNEPVIENHTLMEVRLEIHNPEHPEEAIDWHDGGDDLFHYVMDALELGEPEIMYFYTIGDEPMQKSTIGIEIHPAY
ncbi:hypothetical protein ACX0HA_08875 [Flavobacterium hauense]